MKKIIIFLLLLIAGNTFGQKIFSDTKDPFTNIRTVSTTLDPLYRVGFTNILQVQTSITIQNDSITSCNFAFIVPGLSYETEKIDSSLKDICLLKDESGNIYTGKVTMSVSTTVLGSLYNSYACVFTKDDFSKLMNAKISDVKITTVRGKGGLFPIDKNRQDNIAKQIKAVLKSFK